MAEETKDVSTEISDAGGQGAAEEQQPEKKYTDEDVNNISTKNSAKAVAKLMKELGITDKTDRAKVKALLEKAALEDDAKGTGATEDAQASQLAAALAEAQATAENAILENILLAAHVKAEKVARAAKLVDRKDCLDEEGKFDRDKASAAVTELLKDWTELIEKAEDGKVGFQIGADGQQDNKSKKTTTNGAAQKSWNRFNY